MVYKIIWSPEALQSFFEISNYLENQWRIKSAEKFSNRMDELLETLSRTPSIFRATEHRKNTYRTSISQHTTLIYEANPLSKEVFILQLWPSRSNPATFKY
jgi:plasmid stabilization system protein ParE